MVRKVVRPHTLHGWRGQAVRQAEQAQQVARTFPKAMVARLVAEHAHPRRQHHAIEEIAAIGLQRGDYAHGVDTVDFPQKMEQCVAHTSGHEGGKEHPKPGMVFEDFEAGREKEIRSFYSV